MAEQKEITVRAQSRTGRGKNDARRARAAGMVPVTVYGGEGGTVSALAQLRDLAAILRSESGRNTIFTLDIEGIGTSEVMFHERQIDPVGRLELFPKRDLCHSRRRFMADAVQAFAQTS